MIETKPVIGFLNCYWVFYILFMLQSLLCSAWQSRHTIRTVADVIAANAQEIANLLLSDAGFKHPSSSHKQIAAMHALSRCAKAAPQEV
jgi:hypothetical protein